MELGRLYAEIHRLTNEIVKLIDTPTDEIAFTKNMVECVQKAAKKGLKLKPAKKPERKKWTRTKKETAYVCLDCHTEFSSTAQKLDVTCNECGSPKIDYAK